MVLAHKFGYAWLIIAPILHTLESRSAGAICMIALTTVMLSKINI